MTISIRDDWETRCRVFLRVMRNEQFENIECLKQAYQAAGDSVLSMDMKNAMVEAIANVDEFEPNSFDPILMFGNNFGLFLKLRNEV